VVEQKFGSKDDEAKPEHGAISIAKSIVNSANNIGAGFKQATRTVASDVRDESVAITEHR